MPAAARSSLRFITCGSVDDGKSTLLGRLLVETGSASQAELARCGGDLARLLDALEAEREQGITIDLAHRFFASPRRSFIVADAPGHEQYTRNLVTGASNAELALVLVDARHGILPQTRRHSFLCRLLGVRAFVLVVSKMDLVGWDQSAFDRIVADYREVVPEFTAIPVSGRSGDNVARPSDQMPWYRGPTVLDHLDAADPATAEADSAPFRLPVQSVTRGGVRGLCGLVASGAVRPGDSLRVMPAGTSARVARILLGDATLEQAEAGQSVSIELTEPVDCARGDVLVAAEGAQVADQFEGTIIWLSGEELTPGRQYELKLAGQSALVTILPPKHEIDVNTFDRLPAKTLRMNGIGVAHFWTDHPIVFAPYRDCRELGGFIVIDRISNETVGAGLIHFALRRSENLSPQPPRLSREARAALKGQRPRLVWFTGLSGAGKSTIANLVEAKLYARGCHSFLLDGENIRLGLSRDLGFTDADRAENIRRVGETAKLMLDAGLIVLAAFISPFRAERRMVRALVGEEAFVEVFVHAPLEEAARRDPKGLYAKARAGRLPNFTGIDSPYEPPEHPELVIDTLEISAEDAAEEIVRFLGL
ncbi:adenylyl-sulfate kinase [Sphingomonas parva]|uniref:adenylyl-sulfate kinase n=1 Tax=Sphingomonas parva TaxID=2555898 RepID=UPI00178318A4|nr:adenylyl-sulfate kinase [Sphingomonas parva]